MFFLINQIVAFIFGLFFNIVFLYLIYNHTPQQMRSYSFILKIHATSDIIFDIVNFVTSTHCLVLNGRFYFVNKGLLEHYWTPQTVYHPVAFYFWIVIWIPFGLIPLDFYYRFKLVCQGEAISKKFVATFTFFVYFICLIIVYPINSLYQKVGSSNETLEYDLKLANALNVSTSKLAYVSMGVREPLEIFILILVITLPLVDYAFIAFVVIRIKKKVREEVSENTDRVQTQVSRIMFCQALVPLVLCVPATIDTVAALIMVESFDKYAGYFFSSICWLCALKPFVTICVVSQYRNSLFKMVGIKTAPSQVSPTT